jgi:hypothetical protein
MTSISDTIKSIAPEPQYMYLAKDIQRDCESKMRLRYYEDTGRTSWDSTVAQTLGLVAKCREEIAKCENDLSSQKAKLQRIKTEVRAGSLDVRTGKKQMAEMEAMSAASMSSICEWKQSMFDAEENLPRFQWLQFVEGWQNNQMLSLKFNYSQSKDIDHLERGVTWVVQEAAKMRKRVMREEEVLQQEHRDAQFKKRLLADNSSW